MNAESNVVIITGASQGIGAGLVRGFRERGYRVVANSRSIKPDAFVDPDVLAYFRSKGTGYQSRMNAVLRAYMESQPRRRA